MFERIKRLFNFNTRLLHRLSGQVKQINSQEEQIKDLSHQEIQQTVEDLKTAVQGGQELETVLPEAFALVREAAQRTIGQRHYDVQMMAAIALFEGKAVEQKTGEGKTLAATPALFLRALAGRGAHLVTVNDYLARRDTGWMGQIFDYLGLSVGCIIHDQAFLYDPDYTAEADDERLRHLRPIERKEAYQADITYGTNNEFGFDYLRDNMAMNAADKAQRGHYFAIVDEVDFALIDEARTPLIISSPEAKATDQYYRFAKIAAKLSRETDYTIDEESQSVSLSDHGITKVEKILDIDNLYEKDFAVLHHIENALKAKELFHRDQDYVIKDGEVVIVDEFTGRLMFGRRWSGGLHQAVEAKEGVGIQQESQTLATISFQNYFRLYEVLSGMTGTAKSSEEEFKKIYGLATVQIPTNEPVIRQDYEDVVYKNQRAKYTAVANQVEEVHEAGRPVLVGTTSIEKNEIVASLLKHKGIPHRVLNAKNHTKEAGIIAQAGSKGSVTVATNMAGRGVDIVLGGERPEKVPARGGWALGPKSKNSLPKVDGPVTQKKKEWREKHDEVVELGGLHVIGTERHEARRIDNQLRGRAGRQGDPGSSQFFVALDDDMMRVFGGEQIAGLMERFDFPDNMPITNPLISRSISQIQSKVEGLHFDARRQLVAYDDVINRQREIVYRLRDKILRFAQKQNWQSLAGLVKQRLQQEVDLLTQQEEGLDRLTTEFNLILPREDKQQTELKAELAAKSSGERSNYLFQLAWDNFVAQKEEVGDNRQAEMVKLVFLSTLDRLWVEHLDEMKDLREGVGLRAYGQQDPLVVYKNEAFAKFEQLMNRFDYQLIRQIFKIEVVSQPDVFQAASQQTNIDMVDGMGLRQSNPKQESKPEPVSAAPSPGRNDPCPCGSGEKYKKCCYPKYE